MLVLVDTSVWIDHLHRSDRELVALLQANLVVIHPAVIGELACGNIPNRRQFLALWLTLPRIDEVTFQEAMQMLENRQLWGRGLGWTDIHLIAAALVHKVRLWTRDRLLNDACRRLGLQG